MATPVRSEKQKMLAGAVVGAGSVVTRDVPAGTFAAGNPCRVIPARSSPPSQCGAPAPAERPAPG